jgi:hypothetical protein
MPKNRGGRPLKEIDGDQVRQMSMIGCSIEVIAQHFHVSRDTIERRFRWEIDQGKSAGQIRIRGKLFQAAMNGSQRALEVCAVNLCGMSLSKPDVQVVTNVIQNNALRRTPEQVKAHLVELQRAVLAEARRFENRGDSPSSAEPLPAPSTVSS